uniref:Recombination protein RecR n=2 Tax=unclassified Candidatus Kentrum TaxID=2643149 RepID=A0A451B5A9_9GAMM|nr:MAG: DNA replication and repair protein RecR [Candidatus Kentron sp. LPFa]VFK20935.1 MAG: DNA replication and repair protein RecR [Candidatus Kentron sp. LPFa]VFK27790.1 MAG: DNA replication and repair protein RecR [Candidatus Kentron sp. LPFa]VFK68180.1 MAG: DNA replication and repair protein RecR [Candidatus Kentron sp. UNK]VFK73473.1 MAG: DNA replication and repair protein RecR [Candidatus Kentron sp. UNK]
MTDILIERLVAAFRCLPGVGPKSARRMVYHLLERDRNAGRDLADALRKAMDGVGNCRICRTFTESELCGLCASENRDSSLLCVVETPANVAAIHRGTDYKGKFFVLLGHLSPLDGIGPEHLGLDLLERHLDTGDIREVILATGSTVEGETTAQYIAEIVREREIPVSRIALGVPLGGDLEFVDSGTLSHALNGRGEYR